MINLTIPKSFHILTLEFHFYGLIIGIALAIIYLTLQKSYSNKSFTQIFVLQAIVSLLFGRLAFIVTNLHYFIREPVEMIRVDLGGISILGVILGFLISSLYAAKVFKVTYFSLLDSLFKILPLAQAFGRLGNFINQELFGPPTNLPWGIYIEEQNRPDEFLTSNYFHPLFLYEAILNILSYFLIRKLSKGSSDGISTGIFFLNYGIIRLLMDQLRLDQVPFVLGLSDQDIAAICFIIFGFGLLMIRRKATSSDS